MIFRSSGSNFRAVLRAVIFIFFTCAVLAVLIAGIDAWWPQPLAGVLVHAFVGVMLIAAASVGRVLVRMPRR